jgi:hypothetical protein
MGASRVEVWPEMSLTQLYTSVLEHVPAASQGKFILSFDPASSNIIPVDDNIRVQSLQLK